MAVQCISKFVSFGANRKRVDSLLVVNSNLYFFVPRFRDIADFLLRTATPPPIPLKFWGVLKIPSKSDHNFLRYFPHNFLLRRVDLLPYVIAILKE